MTNQLDTYIHLKMLKIRKFEKKYWIEKEIQMAEFIIAAVQHEITPQAFINALIEAELKKPDDD